ncbi:MAG: hypothetical protein RDU20_05760 [Desulfomonilaceae bacterium]|nr:hypothetical protein [Desulfomonilaceae bacterium]
MGEILSTMDLIMERTRGMALSDEEKEDLRKEDFRKRARGLRVKLMEDPAGCDQILRSVQEESEEDRALLGAYLWEELVREMPSGARGVKHLDLLAKMPQAEPTKPILREAREAFKNAAKAGSKDTKKILLRETKKLASWGISGSAVMPKLPAGSDATGDLARTVEQYKKRLLEKVPAPS